jgi:hypothetical protein
MSVRLGAQRGHGLALSMHYEADSMNDLKQRIDELLANLKQERDELHVKAHLAKMEASDEWTALEAKLVKLNAKARELGGASREASKDIGAAAMLLGEEIRDGFRKIAKRF